MHSAQRQGAVAASPKSATDLAHRREIDGLRAVAVVAVICFHAATPAKFDHAGPAWAPIGARGVDLFFVLSGFCLSWPFESGQMRTLREMLAFWRRRVTRIAPTCWVALALFVLLSLTHFGMPALNGQYADTHYRVVSVVQTAVFFPGFFPIYDPPMWTLGLEMRWYVFFVPLLLVFFRSRVAFVGIACALYYLDNRYGIPDFGILPTFMAGIVAAKLVKAQWRGNIVWPFITPVAFTIAVQHQLRTNTVDHNSIVWIVACFALVVSVATNTFLRRCFSWPPLVAIGVASYSIYLVHAPFVESIIWAGWNPVLAAVAALAIGYAFWFFVERPLCSRTARNAMDACLRAPFYGRPKREREPHLLGCQRR